jgi:hypothetical protein
MLAPPSIGSSTDAENMVRHTDHSLLCWLRSRYFERTCKAPFELSGREATQTLLPRLVEGNGIFLHSGAHPQVARNLCEDLSSLLFSPSAWQTIQGL